MEDEVSKHTKKIYKTIKDPKHSLAEKTKEIIIEILIIVFAVTLSIWFHSWSEHRHEQKEVKEFLSGLRNDLNKDIDLLKENKNTVIFLDSNYKFLYSVKKGSSTDSAAEKVINNHFYFDLGVTHANIGRYEGFKSSGKIGNIENDSLKEKILKFYEQVIPDLSYSESYVNSLQSKILDLQLDRDEKMSISEFATTRRLKSLLNLGIQNFRSEIKQYDEAINKAKEIMSIIDKELE